MYSSASLWRFSSLVSPPQHFKCEEVNSVGTPSASSVPMIAGKLR